MSFPTRDDTRSTLGWGIWVLIMFLVLLVVLVVGGSIAGWITLPFMKGSSQNVEVQFTKGYEMYNSLKQTANMVCDAQKAYNNATGDAKNQRQTQLTAYESNYRRIAGEYDAWSSNVFQGGVIRPNDLPLRAPSLSSLKGQSCDQ